MGVTRLQDLQRAVETDLENIDKWYELGKYAADRFIVGITEEALKKVVRERPDDPNVLALLAKALNRRRKLEESEKVYKRAIELDPDNPELLTGLAVVYGNRGEHEKASIWHKKSLAVDPGYPWNVFAYKVSLDITGNKSEIEGMLIAALESNPDSPLINLTYGGFLKESGSGLEVQKYVDKALQHLDNAPPEERSRSLRALRDISVDLAREHGENLLKQDPDHVDILLSVCTLRSDIDAKAAAAELKVALQKDPHNMRIAAGLMALMLRAGDVAGVMELKSIIENEAPEDGMVELMDMTLSGGDIDGRMTSEEKRTRYIESTRRVLQKFPNNIHLNMRYISALMADDRQEEVRSQIQHVMTSIVTDDTRAMLEFGLFLRQNGFFEDAEKIFSKASDSASSPLESLLVQISLDVEGERYSHIADLVEKYVKKEKADPVLYAILGRVQHYVGHPDTKKNLQIASDGNEFDAKILFASILKKEKDPVRAKILLQDIIDDKDASPLNKTRCLLGLDQEEEAINALERLLDEDPVERIAWLLLLLARRKQGPDAVSRTVKKMIETGTRFVDSTESEKQIRSVMQSEMAKKYTDQVMTGILAGEVKKQLLGRLIQSYLEAKSEG